ncbi:hypothetical protein EIN_227740 [Entamoeba invadens IP1]|uniref:Uncharacterized protein n=1 Tax=Entamoeba invadens IP1 TaxID=370355 RepID=A0A0A1U2Q1_ENTIV|nr:hypothetical protein EIN_227740 [Entamoeba invadens IP1]ELP88351.1 hypothetical protein EIN_227740 [Entamoeba invadens IP1]|eukprot:XP_004255122.1 hypothetical protein EIN_227740 [Entamoeba invadens IP1]
MIKQNITRIISLAIVPLAPFFACLFSSLTPLGVKEFRESAYLTTGYNNLLYAVPFFGVVAGLFAFVAGCIFFRNHESPKFEWTMWLLMTSTTVFMILLWFIGMIGAPAHEKNHWEEYQTKDYFYELYNDCCSYKFRAPTCGCQELNCEDCTKPYNVQYYTNGFTSSIVLAIMLILSFVMMIFLEMAATPFYILMKRIRGTHST